MTNIIFVLYILVMSWFCPKLTSQQPLPIKTQRKQQDSLNPYYHQQLPSYAEDEIAYSGEYWKIDENKYKGQGWEGKLKNAKKASVRYFQLNNTLNARIISQISHICFSQLRTLYLIKNNIVSIESIISLNAPNLLDLDLRDNHITIIKSLRKCNVMFDHLFLSGNPIKDYSSLSQVRFHKKIQRQYCMSITAAENAKFVIDNLAPLFKIEGQQKQVCAHLQLDLLVLDTLQKGFRKQLLLRR